MHLIMMPLEFGVTLKGISSEFMNKCSISLLHHFAAIDFSMLHTAGFIGPHV